jgi:flagellar biosynthesis protein FliQ
MQQAYALDIARQGVQVGLLVCLPILATSLFIGLLVSVFQAITQVQEMTLTFVPKILGIALVMALMGNWMLTTMVRFTILCFERVAILG